MKELFKKKINYDEKTNIYSFKLFYIQIEHPPFIVNNEEQLKK